MGLKMKYRKLLVLIGATFIVSPLAMLSYYGNLLPYLNSYFEARRDQMFLYVDPLWPSTAFRACFSASMIFTSPLEKRFGLRPVKGAAVLLICLSIFSAYFTVMEPLALTFTFGVTHGLAVGVLYTLTMKLLLLTLEDKGGLGSGFMATGPGYGSLINIGIAFVVINPHNKEADLQIGNSVYFSDPGIIHRVPYYFLALGIFTVLVTFSGFLLMYLGSSSICKSLQNGGEEEKGIATFPTKNNYNSLEETCLYLTPDARPSEGIDETVKAREAVLSKSSHPENVTENSKMILEESGTSSTSISNTSSSDSQKQNSLKGSGETVAEKVPTQSTAPEQEEGPALSAELSPREIIRTRQFWCAWLCSLMLNHTGYIHLNLYKQYGQLAISSDAVLVMAGIISMVGMMFTRPLIGLFSDRFGFLNMTMGFCASSSLFMGLMVLVIRTVPVLYVPLAIIEFLAISPQVLIISLLVSGLFGKTNYPSNNGLVNSGQLMLIFAEPFIVQALEDHVGWDWVFLSGAIASAVAAVAMMAVDRKSASPQVS